MAQPEWSYDDEDEDEVPAPKRYDYRAALGPDKFASRETAAGVFGGRTSPARPRPRPAPRRGEPARGRGEPAQGRGEPARGPRPLPKPIVLPEPIASPAAIVVPLVRPVRWVGRDDVRAAGPAPPPEPAPEPARDPAPDPGGPPQLSVRPLRTPAPEVTAIRVVPVPVDGFEYETAALWLNDPAAAAPAEPPAARAEPDPPAPPPVVRTLPWFSHRAPRPERPTISWLDE